MRCDPFDKDDLSRSLFLACENGHSEVVRILISKVVRLQVEVDVNATYYDWKSDEYKALLLAVCNNHFDVVHVLLAHEKTDVNCVHFKTSKN